MSTFFSQTKSGVLKKVFILTPMRTKRGVYGGRVREKWFSTHEMKMNTIFFTVTLLLDDQTQPYTTIMEDSFRPVFNRGVPT